MSQKIINGLLILVLIIIFFSVANAVYNEELYLPIIFYQTTTTITPTFTNTVTGTLPTSTTTSTITPTSTVTPTGTRPTPTPTRTRTPTPTWTPKPGINITYIENNPAYVLLEYVTIKNTSGKTIDMTRWILKNDHNPADIFIFPRFTLYNNQTVNVWTLTGEDTNTDLYWGLSYPVWNTYNDCAWLLDDDKLRVSSYCY